MQKLTRLALLALCTATALLPAWALAAAPASAATPAAGGTAIVVADVSLTNVVSTERNGAIAGQFVLQGKMGEQNNIVYGIEARDKNSVIVDVKKLGEEASIRQGETKQYQFSYTVPTTLRGEISILLVVETGSGLMLGVQELAHTTYQGTGSIFSCVPAAASSVACTASAATSLTASYAQGSVFANPVSTESKNAQKGSQTAFAPALAPGNYFALVTDTAHTQTVAVPFSVSGSYGSIQNVVVTDNKNGTLAVVLLATAVPSTGVSVSVSLTGSSGAVCGSETVPLAGNVVTLSVPSSCTQGTATVTLLDANETALATSVTPFSALAVNAGAATPQNAIQTYLLVAVFLLLILAGMAAFFFLRKKNAAVPPQIMILILVAASLFGGAHHASAATYAVGGTMQYEPCLGGGSWKNGESGCTEPGSWYNAYTTSGTVTVPDIEIPGSSYTIGISDSVSFPSHTTDCYYSGGVTASCDSTNVSTDIYRNLPVPATPYNTLGSASIPGGNPIPSTATYVGGITYPATSGTITTTAPPAGTPDILSFVQLPAAPIGIGCVGGKKGCWTYQKSYTNVQVYPPSCSFSVYSWKFQDFIAQDMLYLGETWPTGGATECVGNCGGRVISISCTPTTGAQCVYNPPPPPGPLTGPGTSNYPMNTSTQITLTCSSASAATPAAPTVHIQFN